MSNKDQKWHYEFNQFDNATEGSFKVMNLLSADHNSKLAAQAMGGEAFFVEMYNNFEPIRDKYNEDYTLWFEAKAIYKAQTMRLTNSLNELVNKKLPKWDAEIQAVFLEKTPEYVEIFPGGRTAFQTGPYETRITRLNRLQKSVEKHEELKKTADDIKTFYDTINKTRKLQQTYEGIVKETSELLEESRVEIARVMYQNLGKLMAYYSDKPEKIKRFFALEYITRKLAISDDEPVIVAEGKVEPETKLTIDALTAKFSADTELIIHNTGDTAIEVYTTKLPDDPVPGTTLTIEADKMAITTCGELGAEENLYLIVFNASDTKTASYSIGVNHYGINQEQIK